MIRSVFCLALLGWLSLAPAQADQNCRTATNGSVSRNCASEAFVTQHFPSSSTAGHVATFADGTGQQLSDGGAAPTGTVTSVTCGAGLTGGTITASGTCAVATDSTAWRVATTTDTIASTDCLKTVVLTNNTFYSETLTAAGSMPTGCRVKVKNGDSYSGVSTGRGRQLIGFPSDLFCILYPGQVVEVQVVNGAWITTMPAGRWLIPGVTVFQNRTSGSDACAADGLASGAGAFKSASFAFLVLYQKLDHQNSPPLLNLDIAGNVAGVTLTECATVQGQLTGINVGFIEGFGGSALWNTSGACAALIIADNAEWEIQNVVVESTTAGGTGIEIHQTGVLDALAGFGCGAFSGGSCIASDHGGFINMDENGGNFPIGPGNVGSVFNLGQGTQLVGSFTAQFLSSPTIGSFVAISGAGTNFILGSIGTSGTPTITGNTCRGPSAFTLGASIPGGAPVATLGCQSL